jgi:hypothetical protein
MSKLFQLRTYEFGGPIRSLDLYGELLPEHATDPGGVRDLEGGDYRV